MEEQRKRVHLSKNISEKLDMIGKLRHDLEKRKKISGNSVDEQITIAELEYRLVKEEMALLALQEKHWESAAHWNAPSCTQRDVGEVLYSYILSVKEKGGVAALHSSEHLHPDNSILISSSQGDSIPRVEWAHHSTDLQVGDRLVEVNGILVIGKDSCEVNQLLASSRPLCRIVFVRTLSPYQLMKSNGACKETSNLRHELTSVVSRLNHKMVENSKIVEQNIKFQKESDEIKTQNRQLKLQIVSLQSVLLYLFQVLEKNNCETNLHLPILQQHPPTMFDILKSAAEEDLPRMLSMRSIEPSPDQKNIPPSELVTNAESDQSIVQHF